MTNRRNGAKPLHEPMVTKSSEAYVICNQFVKNSLLTKESWVVFVSAL